MTGLPVKGDTKVLAIIGHPVRHSLSPIMQNAALEACGLNYVYVPFDVAPEQLGQAVTGFRVIGIAGFNVTIPHKIAVMAHLDELDQTALAAGAVNTVVNDDGRLIGYNTDGDGLVKSLKEELGFEAHGSTIVVLGAGGAARGAIASFCRKGARRVIVLNRTFETAEELVNIFSKSYPGTSLSVCTDSGQLEAVLSDRVLVVNTTSLGMKGEQIPFLSCRDLPRSTVVYDMVYSPQVTPFLKEAEQAGLRCANGLGMLAGQGEIAFRFWTGLMPPEGLMKASLKSHVVS